MSSSRKTIFVAIGANLGIAAAKIVGFVVTGSSAMLSEAIHSVVDCGNGALLLFGQRQGSRPADEVHPFGHGKELYFWTLIVALLIFVLGGGISIVEGIAHVRHPAPSEDATWAYAILGVSILFESYSLYVSVKEFREASGNRPLLEAIKASKDPSIFTVIFEDTAAILGLLTAFIGIFLSHTFGWQQADGIASIIIGLLLIVVAVLLIAKCKTLLVGEGADTATLRRIRLLAQADPDVEKVGYPFTMYFGPHAILLTMNLQFRPGLTAQHIEQAVHRIETAVQAENPDIRHIYLEVGSIQSAAIRDQLFQSSQQPMFNTPGDTEPET
ncbi:cation diffusion facilitator family transporter [Granulicella arctica]|uniref:cation diffusion facilitator family transporter n=1 Tax=Granulicella arctica TaxID=940613 RepID=UPI0021E047D7|nr:cation diffusion facilitator family transporter [Granulicella arctica]